MANIQNEFVLQYDCVRPISIYSFTPRPTACSNVINGIDSINYIFIIIHSIRVAYSLNRKISVMAWVCVRRWKGLVWWCEGIGTKNVDAEYMRHPSTSFASKGFFVFCFGRSLNGFGSILSSISVVQNEEFEEKLSWSPFDKCVSAQCAMPTTGKTIWCIADATSTLVPTSMCEFLFLFCRLLLFDIFTMHQLCSLARILSQVTVSEIPATRCDHVSIFFGFFVCLFRS